MNTLKLILVSPEPLLCAEFREQFKELPHVEVVDGYFETLPEFDCMVSPANSFGLMDGGTDGAYGCRRDPALRGSPTRWAGSHAAAATSFPGGNQA